MHILVLGGGVIGVTTAWYLQQSGHQVTVIEQQNSTGMATSFANAGMVSAGYSSPWAAPGVPGKAIEWLFSKHAPLIFRPTLDLDQYLWMWEMFKQCTTEKYNINKTTMLMLSNYSLDCLVKLRANLNLNYHSGSNGTLQLFRNKNQMSESLKDMNLLHRLNIPVQVLSAKECLTVEPGLAYSSTNFVGGIRLPLDETGDCYIFTKLLTDHCVANGVRFIYNCKINNLKTDGIKITGCDIQYSDTNSETVEADGYVIAMGVNSTNMLKSLGINLPVYPVKGYSMTASIKNSEMAPISTIMDETYKVAITRLGDYIRVGGQAEISGYKLKLRKSSTDMLNMVLTDLFPNTTDIDSTLFWTGARPMTPDGVPVIGNTRYSNLYTNTGHGTLGWTMACGSASLLSDIINKIPTKISNSLFNISRYT